MKGRWIRASQGGSRQPLTGHLNCLAYWQQNRSPARSMESKLDHAQILYGERGGSCWRAPRHTIRRFAV